MSSIIEGYNYDIFISYRQKDNKGDKWVSEFVEAFKTELESTFKEEISVYFDVNPHDGLLETHDVDASLKQKLNCLIFIPVISRTYCDSKSFAWEHEFKAFVEQASQDKFGLKVTLPNGNVASRVLPVRIHDLDAEDIKLCESVLGGFLRGVEFIYKEPGVNRPLMANEDHPDNNLNKTFYRNQINKVANAVKEIITGLRKGEDVSGKNKPDSTLPWEEVKKGKRVIPEEKSGGLNRNKLLSYVVTGVIVLVFLGVFAIPKIFKRDPVERLRASGEKISVAVMPFQNLTNDTLWNVYQKGIQWSLISILSDPGELRVRQKETINELMNTKGFTENASFSPAFAAQISQKLDADIYISGSIQKAGPMIRVEAQLIDTKTKEVIRSFKEERPPFEVNIIPIIDSLGKKVTDFLLISKLIKENPEYRFLTINTSSPKALRYYIYGGKAFGKYDLATAIKCYEIAIAADSNYFECMGELAAAYRNAGMVNKSRSLVHKLKGKRDQMSEIDKLRFDQYYAGSFESPEVRLKYLKQLQEIDELGNYHYLLASTYGRLNQPDKAIAEMEKSLEVSRKWGKESLKEHWAYPALGEAYHRTGQYKKEKQLYREAEQVNDNHRTIYFSWIIRDQASLALTLGDTVAANRLIKELLSVFKENSLPEYDAAMYLAVMYRMGGDKDKTIEYYRKALGYAAGKPDRMNGIAFTLIDKDLSINEGLEIIDKALVLNPNSASYLDTKGWGLYKLGKYNEALELLEKARDLLNPPYSYDIVNHIELVKKAIAGKE
jgi:tetratricopeptide (TPR) repeat protein/TolB-like protein